MENETETYPLSHTWILWFHRVNDNNWNEDSYQRICEVESLKDYWIMINTLTNVTSGMFFLMRDNVFPRWEDINNIDGGYWTFRVSRKSSNNVWTELVASVIGNTLTKDLENMGIINGISISPKINNCIFKIWNNDAGKENTNILTDDIPGIILKEAMYKKHQEQTDFKV